VGDADKSNHKKNGAAEAAPLKPFSLYLKLTTEN
jgi:hypothetical protein